MMKKTLALLMACLLLTGTALAETNIYEEAFAKGQAALVEMPLLAEDETYTLRGPSTPIIASEAYYQQQGITPEGEMGYAENTLEITTSGKGMMQSFFLEPLAVSPDGQTQVLAYGAMIVLLKGNTLTPVALNLERSGGAPQGVAYAQEMMFDKLGGEGLIWSPDGRYIAFPNAHQVLLQFKSQPLMLLDTQKGELFTAKAYEEGSHALDISTFSQGVFSADSQHFYYTDTVEGTTRLNRYTMESSQHEVLLDLGERFFAFPGMAWTAEGNLLCYMTREQDNAQITFLKEGDTWTSQTEDAPDFMMPYYMQATPAGIFTRMYFSSGAMLPMINGQWLSAAEKNGSTVITLKDSFSTEEDLEAWMSSVDENTYAVTAATLSPSGQNALLMVSDGNGDNRTCHLMDMQTMATLPLDLSEDLQLSLSTPRPGSYHDGLHLTDDGMVFSPVGYNGMVNKITVE